MLVADPNVLIELVEPTANAEAVQAVLASDQDWYLPGLCIPKLRHILLKYRRAGAILQDEALAILAEATAQFAHRTISVNTADCLAIAHRHGCSNYDAEFVVLARQLGCPLLTFDRKLLQQFADVALKPGSSNRRRQQHQQADHLHRLLQPLLAQPQHQQLGALGHSLRANHGGPGRQVRLQAAEGPLGHEIGQVHHHWMGRDQLTAVLLAALLLAAAAGRPGASFWAVPAAPPQPPD